MATRTLTGVGVHSALTAPETMSWTRKTAVALAGTLFIAVCAHLSIPLPFTPVPVTLQPFAILLLALLFGPELGAATALLYLVEGASGLPVFTPHGLGGLAQLLGPTGGYLMSYPLAAWCTGWIAKRSASNSKGAPSSGKSGGSFVQNLGASFVGNVLILSAGTLWLEVLTHASLRHTLGAAVLPFLAGDLMKLTAAAAIATAWRRFLKVQNTDAPVAG